jgi:hypothetical protein
MNARSRLIVKGAFAVLVGLPGTVVFLPLIALTIFGSASSIAVALGEGAAGHVAIAELLPAFVWSVAGFFGLIGFWAWVFSRSPIPSRARLLIGMCVFVGVLSIAPFLFVGSCPHAALAVAGIVAGAIVCWWLVQPTAPFDLTGRTWRRPMAAPEL